MLTSACDVVDADLPAAVSCCESPALPHPKGALLDTPALLRIW